MLIVVKNQPGELTATHSMCVLPLSEKAASTLGEGNKIIFFICGCRLNYGSFPQV